MVASSGAPWKSPNIGITADRSYGQSPYAVIGLASRWKRADEKTDRYD